MFVQLLGLKSVKEWKEWSKSGQRPSNIPSNPDQVYRGKGWVSMPDWLGCEKKGRAKTYDFLPFLEARAIYRGHRSAVPFCGRLQGCGCPEASQPPSIAEEPRLVP